MSINRGHKYKPREGHWNWKGGKFKNGEGYILLLIDGKYILEHKYKMEKKVGRKLKRNEVVHHINETRDDNRLKNLRLMTRGDHSALHNTGKKASERTRKLYREIRKDTNQNIFHTQWNHNVTLDDILYLNSTGMMKKDIANKLEINVDTLRNRINFYKKALKGL